MATDPPGKNWDPRRGQLETHPFASPGWSSTGPEEIATISGEMGVPCAYRKWMNMGIYIVYIYISTYNMYIDICM